MNDEPKPLKIAYLTMSEDPLDRRAWSGLIYYIAQSLQRHCGEVAFLSPVCPCWMEDHIAWLIRGASRILLKRKYNPSFFLAKSYAKAATRWLEGKSFDVIVAPESALETAFLETEIPVVLVGDATFGSLINYYPRYSHLMKRSVYELHAVQELALKKASAIIYSSAWAAGSAIKDYATNPAKVHVVPFGANLEHPPSREIALERKKSGHCRLLFLGVEWQRKGGDIAFETLLQLGEMGIEAELIVCGCIPPKSFVHERMKVIPFLNKNDERQRKELETLLMLSDFLLLPTRNECYGLVFCEANAFGLPVISTNTGGVSEIVRDGENGFLLPISAGGAEYAEVIARAYSDSERYADMVRRSRAAFENRLNWDVWGIAVKKILAEHLDYQNSSSEDAHVTAGFE
jgi:glycosyltransferase involved in cell wall biosynthesis